MQTSKSLVVSINGKESFGNSIESKPLQGRERTQAGGPPVLFKLPFIITMMFIVWYRPVNQLESTALADSELLMACRQWQHCDSDLAKAERVLKSSDSIHLRQGTEGLNLVFPLPFDEFFFQKGQHTSTP